MAKAAVPYDALQIALEQIFPEPIFQNVRVVKPRRDNRVKAPTAIYDRSTGNFQKIGYKCLIRGTMVTGIDRNWNYVTKKDFSKMILIEL
jgi:hypothetical protein